MWEMPCILVERYHAQHAFKLADTLYYVGGLLMVNMCWEILFENISLYAEKLTRKINCSVITHNSDEIFSGVAAV